MGLTEEDMSDKERTENIHDDGTYVVKRTRKSSVIAFIVCILIALVIWCYAKADAIKNSEAEETADDKVAAEDTAE